MPRDLLIIGCLSLALAAPAAAQDWTAVSLGSTEDILAIENTSNSESVA